MLLITFKKEIKNDEPCNDSNKQQPFDQSDFFSSFLKKEIRRFDLPKINFILQGQTDENWSCLSGHWAFNF